MSVVTRRIYHISAASTTLLNTQMGVEDSNDSDLGFRMWCGRDDVGIGPQTGTITKFLAKDQNARVVQLEATSRMLVTSGADITASAAAFTPSGNFGVTAGGTLTLESGTNKASIELYPSTNGDIRFSDAQMYGSWTQKYCKLSDNSAETAQYKTDFGEVSIFAALHACLSSGASADDTEVVYGTGTGITSSANMTFASDVLTLAGRFNVENVSWGTPETLTVTSNTITPNFSTGKDIQVATITSGTGDISNLGTLTAPAGTSAKNLLIACINTDSYTHTVGGGTGWSQVKWEKNGTDPGSPGITVGLLGGAVVFELEYHNSTWYGKVWEYEGELV